MIEQKQFILLIVVSIMVLSVIVVAGQIEDVGFRFINVQQIKFHQKMLDGIAGNPWQYRILSDILLVPFRKVFWRLGIPNPDASAFITFRFAQSLLILASAGIYYKKLGIYPLLNLIGLSILAWGMSYSLYDSELSFNTFFDVAFFLIAAILLLDQKFIWIIPLTVLAALNRETSILIPVMLAALAIFGINDTSHRTLPIVYAGIAMTIFLIIFIGLRLYYGEQSFISAYGNYPGISTLYFNLVRWITWQQIFLTLGIIPLLAILAYKYYPKNLTIFFWTIVPAWFIVHLFAAIMAETRLLLVPQALIFIPAACFGAQAINGKKPNQRIDGE